MFTTFLPQLLSSLVVVTDDGIRPVVSIKFEKRYYKPSPLGGAEGFRMSPSSVTYLSKEGKEVTTDFTFVRFAVV